VLQTYYNFLGAKKTRVAAEKATERTNENSKEPEQEDEVVSMEEFHNADTVHTGGKLMLTGAKWKEIHLLVQITYKDVIEACSSPPKHTMVLKAMGYAFDNTELQTFNNKNWKLSLATCRKMKNIEHYESHFKIHEGNGRHYVIFRVLSTI
jgi:hypothetical protein